MKYILEGDGRTETGETDMTLDKEVGISNKGAQGVVFLPKECIGKRVKVLVLKHSTDFVM